MVRNGETARLQGLFTRRRDRLLDLSGRNPLVSYKHRPTSKRQLRFVEAVPDVVYDQLVDESAALSILSLPEPDEIPRDERTDDFTSRLDHARSADATYLARLQELENAGADGEFELAQAERQLRDRVRAELGLPPRPLLKAINPIDRARELSIEPSFDLPMEGWKDSPRKRELQTLKWPDALDALLDKVSDDARLAEQEMGLSTLFLVFGFLEWFEAETSDKHHTAPLLLLPVKLERKKSPGRKTVFNLVATSEQPETNLSLRKRIERDFNLLLPDFTSDEDTPRTVSEYLAAAQATIEGQKRWCVRPQLTLGHFAFGRLAIYADLDPEKWPQHPVQHHLVRAALSGTEGAEGASGPQFGPAEDYPIDDPEMEAIAPHLIHDADASQHSALIDVMMGKNLVVQGPPGTGKSQTITNVIANLIGSGKTVLFLAEKQAALEVVKRRMDKAGLGELCLELHSDRVSSRSVIESLRARAAIGFGRERKANGLHGPGTTDRHEIAEYLSALHQPLDSGVTPFAAIWRSLRAASREALQLNRFGGVPLPEELLHDAAAQERLMQDLSRYCGMLGQFEQRFGRLAVSPWSEITLAVTIGPGDSVGLLDRLAGLRSLSQSLVARIEACARWGIATSATLERAAGALAALPPAVPAQAMLDALRAQDRSVVRGLLDALEELAIVEREGSHLPRLNDADSALLKAIERTAAIATGEEEARERPAELRQKAGRASHAFRYICERLKESEPLAQLAGVRGGVHGCALTALSLVAEALARTPGAFRAWALALDDAKSARLDELHGDWERLAHAEARWRSRFPSLGHDAPWPSPAELNHVAGLLRKGLLGRLIGSLGGDRQAAEQLAHRLFLPAIALPGPNDLQELAQHVEQLGAWLANRAHRHLLGGLWTGLDTPFEELRRICREALCVLAQVRAIEGGDDLLRELRSKDQDALERIAAGREILRPFRELLGELASILSTYTIDEILTRRREADERLAGLTAADAANLLVELPSTLGELEQARRLQTKRRALTACIRDIGLPTVMPVLCEPGGIESAQTTLDWLDATENADLPSELKEVLLRSAGEAGQARSEAAACIGLLKQIREQSLGLEQQFGLTGLQMEDAHGLLAQIASLLDAGSQLKEIIELRHQKQRLDAAGIGALLRLADDLDVPPSDWCALLSGLIARRQAGLARVDNPALRRASGLRLDVQRQAFINQDRQRLAHDREVLRDAASARKPPAGLRIGPIRDWTEMWLLKREFEKERRLLPARQLVARAGRAMLALKPCFMMSPLSLAKFLPAESVEFDVLVVDEASQMRPEDALGGLLRARQVVVVGDQKQLPPSDFFARAGEDNTAASDEEDFEDVDDESILEACQKAFSNTRMLRWHYRSRCESLISFSNTHFYSNELITFPVARPGSFSVELRQVQGAYEARRNPPEAQQIVAEAIAFMREHADHNDDAVPTLGIVAVNKEQRDLIKEELRLRASRDACVERFQEKAKARGEELFIKNLENVQGDERDVILISLTYGPKPGQASPHQRFGPINGKHGHRRLNVLFSRARDRIVLFTSLRSDQIVGDPGKSMGPQILKAYLAYAEAGGQAVPEGIGGQADSDFEIEVRQRLERHGYQVDAQVGVSRYRIDLGVRNPDRPGVYLAGIECDGASYHSSKSARDRDRLRQDCLQGAGWDILRVWSTDWFDDPDGQTDKLVRELEALRQQAVERSRQEEQQRLQRALSPEPEEDSCQTEGALLELAEDGAGTLSDYSAGSGADSSCRPPPAVRPRIEPPTPGLHSVAPNPAKDRTRFVMAQVADCGVDPNPDRFYETSYRPVLRLMVHHVIDTEGPIYHSELVTRIARAHAFQRNGGKIEERVLAAVGEEIPRSTEADGKVVYWPQGSAPASVVPFRRADPDTRSAGAIPLAELAGLARELLTPDRHEAAVIERMREELGLGRLREATRTRLAECIKMATEASKDSSAGQVRAALERLCIEPSEEDSPLAISTLRGEHADNGQWRADPARPAIIVGTVDMIGSRLLFSGYGVSRRMRPFHAGLLGHDALIVHDEAHLSPAFGRLVRQLHQVQVDAKEPRPIQVMELSATQREAAQSHEVFALTAEEEAEERVARRLRSAKTLRFIPMDDEESAVDGVVRQAEALEEAHPEPKRVVVYIRSPRDAAAISKRLAERFGSGSVALLTGTIRGYERDQMASPAVTLEEIEAARAARYRGAGGARIQRGSSLCAQQRPRQSGARLGAGAGAGEATQRAAHRQGLAPASHRR